MTCKKLAIFASQLLVDHFLAYRWPIFRPLPRHKHLDIKPGMGQKISIDSATMMNKGLEVIEAAWLFGLTAGDEVLVHPQVAIHGLVYFRDGSVIGQLGTADENAISYALEWPTG